ncbi:MAG: PhnD/SsuA/transferrin family substrate-binding protein [Bacillota bacterium]|nr:PhnD/SsuA/transferrin family substrate-binding protein [Bacillota bacterium]
MRKSLIVVMLISLLLVIGGCAEPVQQDTGVNEEVQMSVSVLRGPTAVGMIKMIDENRAPSNEVNVTYIIEQSPDVLASKLLSGEVDIATVPTNMAANLYNKGIDYQLAGVSIWGVMYVVSSDASIKSWSDLKNKDISCAGQGAASDLVFKYLLEMNQVDSKEDVNLQYISSPVELAQSVIAGKGQIAVLPEPWVSKVLDQNPECHVVLNVQEEWSRIHGANLPDESMSVKLESQQEWLRQNGGIPFAQTSLVVRKQFAAQYPDIVEGFLRIYGEEIGWINEHPAQAGELVEKQNLGLSAEVASAAIPRCNLYYVESQVAKPATEGFLQVLFDASPQSIGGKMPDEQFYY